MVSDLKCECCEQFLSADFSSNVWCTNNYCLCYDKVFSHDFIEGRANAVKQGDEPQLKERLLQGSVNEPLK